MTALYAAIAALTVWSRRRRARRATATLTANPPSTDD
jgi:hypothetical protein